jgi:hypothetical protein
MYSLAKHGAELVRNNYLIIFFALAQGAQNTRIGGRRSAVGIGKIRGTKLLFAQQMRGIDMQCPSHRSNNRKCSGEHHSKCNRGKHKWVLGGGLVDDGGEESARRHAQHQVNPRAAGEQDQHTAERCGENLLCLGAERNPNTQLLQPPADRIGSQAEGCCVSHSSQNTA